MRNLNTFKDLIIFKDLETNQDWNICIDDNGSKLGRCIYACNNDDACEDQCVDQFKTRQFNCPCEVQYLHRPVYIVSTFFQDNCPAGCPCDDYPCMETTIAPEVTTLTTQATTISPTTNAVLVLSTRYGSNKPMVIDWDGKLIFELKMSSP